MSVLEHRPGAALRLIVPGRLFLWKLSHFLAFSNSDPLASAGHLVAPIFRPPNARCYERLLFPRFRKSREWGRGALKLVLFVAGL